MGYSITPFQQLDYAASDDRMRDELKGIWKEAIMA
jgi:hypothetical protein